MLVPDILAKAGLKKVLNKNYMMGESLLERKTFRVRLKIKGENKKQER